MTHPLKQRKIISLKGPVQQKIKALEYRIVWNEVSGQWDVHRNGVKTGLARRKKKSGIDLAILAIRSDESFPVANATVVSVKDGLQKTEWKSSPAELPLDNIKQPGPPDGSGQPQSS
jgi:hypothetical protein